MSASITTNGMTARLRNAGQRFPGPWAMTASGAGDRRSERAAAEPPGTLLPTGGKDHGHKGYNLALAIEALSQGLSGHGRADPLTDWGASVYIQVMDPEAFGGAANFRPPDRLHRRGLPAQSARTRRRGGPAARRAGPRPQAPGARARACASIPASWHALRPLAAQLGVAPPEPIA